MAFTTRGSVVSALILSACTSETADELAQSPSGATGLDTASLRYQVRDVPRSLPDYGQFDPQGLTPNRAVIANASGCDSNRAACREDLVKWQLDGQYSVIAERFRAYDMNRAGDVAGCFVDHVNDSRPFGEAAIVRRDGSVRRLPRGAGEAQCVIRMSDGETVLVASIPEDSYPGGSPEEYWYVDIGGDTYPVPTDLAVETADVNDRGQLALTLFPYNPQSRTPFRFDAQSQVLTQLADVTDEVNSRACLINQRGDVLGYSLANDSEEHIGYWNLATEFTTVARAESPATSGWVTWTESGLVIASGNDDRRTYVIPEPNVLLDLASLVDHCNVPDGLSVARINENGEFLAGRSPQGTYHVSLHAE